MTDEEKKAIEHLEFLLDDGILASEDEPHIEIILKLIEQQKERINYLEDLLSTMEEYYSITIEDLENCIKNDK